jgi:Tfp pilus assembly protein PilX
MFACGTGRQPQGAALVIAMLVMAVLLMAGTTFLTISSTESQIALNQRASVQAFLLAESAIHKAIVRLNADSTYTGETSTALGGGTFTVAVTTAAGCTASSARLLVATASVPLRGGQAQAVVQATVDRVSYLYRWAAFAAVPNQVVVDARVDSELWLEEYGASDSYDSTLGTYSTTTNKGTGGTIGANGDIDLDGSVQIQGNVRAGDGLYKGSGVTISGTQAVSLSPTSTSSGERFPSVTPQTAPTTGLTVTSGTYTLAAGTYYYTTMTFSDNTSLAATGGLVTIYVTGAVSLGNSVTFGTHPDTQLRIIAKSDGSNTDFVGFNAGNNFTLYGSLYGKNTNIEIGDDAGIYGSMIGRMVHLGKRAAIHYDQAMSRQELCHNGNFNIRRGTWREVRAT